jgi:hypothetical protein|tara:strand:- start:1356 stop:1574 length:219 start_codon:yes stop_codon:yes gene_type:complete
MVFNIEAIIYYAFLLDSLGANITAWFFAGWYKKNINKGVVKHFPATKGWTLTYLVLVLWIGFGLYRLGILPW